MKLITDYAAVQRHVETAFLRAADEVVGEAKKNAPVSVSRGLKLNAGGVQGGLRASINFAREGRLSGRVGSPVRHAMMREKGGTILPVRRRFLSWIDPITGERRFAKRVRQRPGGARQRRPYTPWLAPAGERFGEFMEDHLKALG